LFHSEQEFHSALDNARKNLADEQLLASVREAGVVVLFRGLHFYEARDGMPKMTMTDVESMSELYAPAARMRAMLKTGNNSE
jgi:hypothetical protein